MNDYLTEQMEELNLTAASESFTKLFPGYQIDMNSLFDLILEGQAGEAFKMITQAVKEGFAGDLAGMKTLLVSILLIGIFSASARFMVRIFHAASHPLRFGIIMSIQNTS